LTPDDFETQAGRIVELLGSVGEVVVTIPAHCLGLAKQLFGYIMTNPADVCAMMCYPRLRAVRRLGGIVRIELEISEVIQ
jgi:ABC-type lipopolysaccharide export system ATPase subunit